MIEVEYPDGQNREEWLETIKSKKNPFYRFPDDPGQRIWRYMDFTKFMFMIESGSLFFHEPLCWTIDTRVQFHLQLSEILNRSSRTQSIILKPFCPKKLSLKSSKKKCG